LNIGFIRIFGMGVEGVALATIVAQAIAAVLVICCLMQSEGALHLELSRVRLTKEQLVRILRIGLPAGMQGAIFSASNVLIQSSINSFGSIAMAGSTAASNIENFVYVSMNACHQTAVSFVSQNLGAGKLERIKHIFVQCILLVVVIGLVMGMGCHMFSKQLLGIYSSDSEVIWYGMRRLALISAPYFICGVMDTLVGCIRGLGSSVLPMVVSLVGACGLRILWIFTIFRWFRSWDTLFVSYPVTWTVTAIVHLICLVVLYRHQKWILRG